MDSKALDKVLSCPQLPTLPGVAIRMLELMRQRASSADQVAQVIQNDPALATKVLRTVNSSYYGLSKPCPSIRPAVAFLGMNTVKSLTLGLSLVDLGRNTGNEFDLVSYWRRAVYGAAACRVITRLSRVCDPDEAFIATLLQDVGMLACFAALGVQYAGVVSKAGEDHDALPQAEVDQLGFDHAEAGARLAEKWRLPDQIVACARFHHRPEAAPESHAGLVRVIAASADAAAALTATEPQAKLVAFRRRMREWFDVDGLTADEALHQTGAAAKELSTLLELDTGQPPDVAAILSEAGEQLLHHQVDMERAQNELAKQTVTDALTGIANRKHFDREFAREFDEARTTSRPLSLLFTDADRFKSVNDTLGHQAGDAVLIETSRRIREVTGADGTVCRYGGEEFAVILPGMALDAARALAERIRLTVDSRPIDLHHLNLSTAEVRQTISLGVASLEGGKSTACFTNWQAMVQAADDAVYAAKNSGRNRVWCAGAAATPAGAGSAARNGSSSDARPLILIVEDDALSAKMLEALLGRHAQARTLVRSSGQEALGLLCRNETPLRPDLVLVDLQLPAGGGMDLIRAFRDSADLNAVPVVAMSSRASVEQRREAAAAGATGLLDKSELCADVARTVRWLADLSRGLARAA